MEYKKADYEIALTELTGLKIKEIIGYISNEFGEPCFKLTKLIFENDKMAWIAGEHDSPYISDGPDDIEGLDKKNLEKIDIQANGDE